MAAHMDVRVGECFASPSRNQTEKPRALQQPRRRMLHLTPLTIPPKHWNRGPGTHRTIRRAAVAAPTTFSVAGKHTHTHTQTQRHTRFAAFALRKFPRRPACVCGCGWEDGCSTGTWPTETKGQQQSTHSHTAGPHLDSEQRTKSFIRLCLFRHSFILSHLALCCSISLLVLCRTSTIIIHPIRLGSCD